MLMLSCLCQLWVFPSARGAWAHCSPGKLDTTKTDKKARVPKYTKSTTVTSRQHCRPISYLLLARSLE